MQNKSNNKLKVEDEKTRQEPHNFEKVYFVLLPNKPTKSRVSKSAAKHIKPLNARITELEIQLHYKKTDSSLSEELID